jgi:hypothetical protein
MSGPESEVAHGETKQPVTLDALKHMRVYLLAHDVPRPEFLWCFETSLEVP